MTTHTSDTSRPGVAPACIAIVAYRSGEFGYVPVICTQVVGVRTFVSTAGLRVGYCALDGHEASVRRRFTERAIEDIPEPAWLHDQPEYADDMTFAKWTADRDESWTRP